MVRLSAWVAEAQLVPAASAEDVGVPSLHLRKMRVR
jgi:hypothetical protein